MLIANAKNLFVVFHMFHFLRWCKVSKRLFYELMKDKVLHDKVDGSTVINQLFFLHSVQILEVIEQVLLLVSSEHLVYVGLHCRIGSNGISLGSCFAIGAPIAASGSHVDALSIFIANLVGISVACLYKITHY